MNEWDINVYVADLHKIVLWPLKCTSGLEYVGDNEWQDIHLWLFECHTNFPSLAFALFFLLPSTQPFDIWNTLYGPTAFHLRLWTLVACFHYWGWYLQLAYIRIKF